MRDIHEVLDVITLKREQSSVLATIIDVKGSAYKKEGAMMLFTEDGRQAGMLSAGCLEEDLAARIALQHYQVKTEVITYDMRNADEWSWGEGSGCNGVITILIEPVTANMRHYFMELNRVMQEGFAVTMIKTIPSNVACEETVFFQVENGHVFGDDSKEKPNEFARYIKQSDRKGNGIKESGCYVQYFQAKPRLIIYGAGRDAEPLVEFASKTGFAVTIADWRQARCQQEVFPTAERIVLGFPEEVIKEIEVNEKDYVVLMSHSFRKDKEIIQQLSGKKMRYFGILGSLKRTKRLFAGKDIPSTITSPIGLSIDAEGPEEIAISVVAELVKLSERSRDRKVRAS
ncbi:XdhC family protein [Paraliobacillus sediminis]|uniref:XdhC family protein n=1 Tax=Paraliobacillus sediminis TaxID=1885916 RepID=UPI000E3BB806|nr:XdhC/CoxI family protein [Paraliobacillus sediminis]